MRFQTLRSRSLAKVLTTRKNRKTKKKNRTRTAFLMFKARMKRVNSSNTHATR